MSFYEHTIALIAQIEFYFSPFNLPQDTHLQALMNPHGWVLLAEICTWPRMVLLGAANPFEVAKAIAGFSLALEVDISYQFIRMRPNPLYIVPGSFHPVYAPHVLPGMPPLPLHVHSNAQLHIHSPQANFLSYPEGALSISLTQHPVSSDHVIAPPNTTPSSVELPDCLPIEMPEQPSGHSLHHLPTHCSIPVVPPHADQRFIYQQQVAHDFAFKSCYPIQPAIPTAAASECNDQMKSHGSQHHLGRKVAEPANVTPDINEADKDNTNLTCGTGENRCARDIQDGPTQPRPKLTEETEQVQCQSFQDTPYQQLHHVGSSLKKPSSMDPSHSGTELEQFTDQHASPNHLVHMPLSYSSSAGSGSFQTNRAAFPEENPQIAIPHDTGFLGPETSGLHAEQLGSDVSSDGNEIPNYGLSTTSNRAASTSPALGQLKHTTPHLHANLRRAKNFGQPFSRNKPGNPTRRRPYGHHSHPSQHHHRSSNVRPKMSERRSSHRSNKHFQSNRHNPCKHSVAHTERSLLCRSSFPPLSISADASLMGRRMKAIKSQGYLQNTAGQVWAKKPVSVLQTTPASSKHDAKVGQRAVGPGIRP